MLAQVAASVHTPGMALKSAAVLAFVGTVLTAVLLLVNLANDIAGVARGFVPATRLFSGLIYAFTTVALAIFFYVFQKQDR